MTTQDCNWLYPQFVEFLTWSLAPERYWKFSNSWKGSYWRRGVWKTFCQRDRSEFCSESQIIARNATFTTSRSDHTSFTLLPTEWAGFNGGATFPLADRANMGGNKLLCHIWVILLHCDWFSRGSRVLLIYLFLSVAKQSLQPFDLDVFLS